MDIFNDRCALLAAGNTLAIYLDIIYFAAVYGLQYVTVDQI